jgi:hypothetical protein
LETEQDRAEPPEESHGVQLKPFMAARFMGGVMALTLGAHNPVVASDSTRARCGNSHGGTHDYDLADRPTHQSWRVGSGWHGEKPGG